MNKDKQIRTLKSLIKNINEELKGYEFYKELALDMKTRAVEDLRKLEEELADCKRKDGC